MNKSSSSSKERPPRRQPKQQRGKDRLEKILIAAAEVFVEVGFSAATTQQIADRADTAIGSIYQFFPDKVAIFQTLEEEHYKTVLGLDRWVQDADIDRPLSDLISELIDGYIAFLTNPISRCIVFQLLQPHVPGLFVIFDRENETLEQQSIARFADIYQRRNPELSPKKCQLLSEVAHHTYQSLFLTAVKIHNPDRRQEIFAELKDLLYGYLDPHIGDRFIVPLRNSLSDA
jgi:AcrR family transcriptional regulator